MIFAAAHISIVEIDAAFPFLTRTFLVASIILTLVGLDFLVLLLVITVFLRQICWKTHKLSNTFNDSTDNGICQSIIYFS